MPGESVAAAASAPADKSSWPLYTGAKIPAIGLGTWKAEPGEVAKAVKAAVKAGYKHIDCAANYANEAEVGDAFKEIFDEGTPRESLWITSKLWTDHCLPGRVEAGLKQTLKDLKIDYLDLFLIHWPLATNAFMPEKAEHWEKFDLPAVWKELEACVDKGLTKHIGVANFSQKKLYNLLQICKIRPAVNQVEMHPLWRNDPLLQYCRSENVHVTAYSALGSPDSGAAGMHNPDSGDIVSVMHNQLIQETADKLGKTVPQLLLRWAVQRGTSALAKSTNEEHLKSNLDIFSFDIPQEDFQKLSSIPEQKRLLDGNWFYKVDGAPFKDAAEIFDGEV
eukprot:jgi/Chlat1/7707/Chrsp66S07317